MKILEYRRSILVKNRSVLNLFHAFYDQAEDGLESKRWIKEINRQIKEAGGVISVSCKDSL